MIERFYVKNFLTFQEAELELQNGLVVFSGPSGSGKSILMNAVLSAFGLGNADASVCEASAAWKIDEAFGIENEEINVFRQLKKEKTRYFINAQGVSKKTISAIASKHLRHLSLKDYSDFENENLLKILDNRIAKYDKSIKEILDNLKESFSELQKVKKELSTLEDEQRHVIELKEFAIYEIEKIESVDPKIGEYEELIQIKKELSKKEKVEESIERASSIFELEFVVSEALELLEEESAFFDDAMNELRTKLESASERFAALEEVNIEDVLDRLEVLSELKRKYGSIEEALEYKERKKEELKRYENIEFSKEELERRVEKLTKKTIELSDTLTEKRLKEIERFKQDINDYAKLLYLQNVTVMLHEGDISTYGQDIVKLRLNGIELEKISTGEFNRLRLAVLAIKSEITTKEGGVLVLDEIDANLSGEESMSVAKVLKKLATSYQILVISHQPQLTSQGDQHFLVYKENGASQVKELDKQERIDEIARIISGESITKEAVEFATQLLQ